MKKLLFILLVFSVLKLNAADIYVNNSGQAGTYTAIQTAINAAATGDRIFVSPYGVYTENLTIGKSLTITSGVANTRFSVVGSVTITSAPNQDVIIIGGEFSGSITGNTGTATSSNKAKIALSDCISSGFSSGNFILSKILFSKVLGNIVIENGIICGSRFGEITVQDGPNNNIGDTVHIISNVGGSINWYSNDHFFLFSNNFIQGSPAMRFTNSVYSTSINNKISNNSINGGSNYSVQYATVIFPMPSGSNMSNIIFTNNIIQNPGSNAMAITCGVQLFNGAGDQSNCSSNAGLPQLYYNYIKHTNPYNSPIYAQEIVGNVFFGTTISFDELGKPSTVNENTIDKGLSSIEYYDIDLTRNDIGTYGGPYSIDNYWNTANGRARVYDLNMPFEIWNGSTPSIKAEGIHIK